MNEPTTTTDALLAELDADLLVNPKRTTDDLLLELSLAAKQLDQEAQTLAHQLHDRAKAQKLIVTAISVSLLDGRKINLA
jgi:hypothetical protein